MTGDKKKFLEKGTIFVGQPVHAGTHTIYKFTFILSLTFLPDVDSKYTVDLHKSNPGP